MVWQQRDVNDPDFLTATIHVEPPRRCALHLDDRILRIRIIPPIIGVLRGELHVDKSAFLLVAPWHPRQFLRARTGIDRAQKLFVLRCYGPQPEELTRAALHR